MASSPPGPATAGHASTGPANAGPAAASAPPGSPSPSPDSPCVHCGFCLPTCPTYDVLGTEVDSPRGRLVLMGGLADGSVAPTPRVIQHLDQCLGCLACETACPSGVPYGEHLHRARVALREHPARDPGRRRLETLALAMVALPPALQRLGSRLLALVVATGLARVAAAVLPGRLGAAAGLAAASPPRVARLPASLPPTRARGDGRRPRVGLLTGCVGGAVLGDVTEAAARLLASAGCEVVVPPRQVCCGALHTHAGDLPGARRLLEINLEAFGAAGPLDAVAVTAAGCGSALKQAAQLVRDDPLLEPRARAFAASVRDTLELLDELGLPTEQILPAPPGRPGRPDEPGPRAAGDRSRPPGDGRSPAQDGSVACLDACHLAHAQGLPGLTARVLGRVPGLELAALDDGERCCGSAGIYNLLHPEPASSLGRAQVERAERAGASTLTAANAGCLLHLAAEARRAGSSLRCEHPLTLLDRAQHGPPPA